MTLGIISLGKTRHIVWPADSDRFFYLIEKNKTKRSLSFWYVGRKKMAKSPIYSVPTSDDCVNQTIYRVSPYFPTCFYRIGFQHNFNSWNIIFIHWFQGIFFGDGTRTLNMDILWWHNDFKWKFKWFSGKMPNTKSYRFSSLLLNFKCNVEMHAFRIQSTSRNIFKRPCIRIFLFCLTVN